MLYGEKNLKFQCFMKKINKIMIGTHNNGKFKEICDLLPKNIIKISPKDLNLLSPDEIGSTFEENSKIKAEYFAKKANLIAISDDSGLMINLLSGAPGIYSSRWAGPTNDFNVAIEKVFSELQKIKFEWNKRKKIVARFISCLTLYWPNGKSISSTGRLVKFKSIRIVFFTRLSTVKSMGSIRAFMPTPVGPA